jgi:hypothetical protein
VSYHTLLEQGTELQGNARLAVPSSCDMQYRVEQVSAELYATQTP